MSVFFFKFRLSNARVNETSLIYVHVQQLLKPFQQANCFLGSAQPNLPSSAP